MADRLSRVAAFILGPSAKDDEDDFESEAIDAGDDEPTDIVAIDAVETVEAVQVPPRERPLAVHQGGVTSLDQRRRPATRPLVLSEIHHVRPLSFAEAAGIGESYRDGVTIILNFSNTDEKQAQKLIDFSSGMAFVTGGKLEKITPKVFILIPAAVHLTAIDRDQLLEEHKERE